MLEKVLRVFEIIKCIKLSILIENRLADREDDGPPQVDAPMNSQNPSSAVGYTPPTNLYAFPPNINAVYPPPGDTRKPISISSYLPPPSGPTNFPIYPGPIAPQPNPPLDDNAGPDNDENNGNSGGPYRPADAMQIFEKPSLNVVPEKKPAAPPLSFFDQHHHHDHDHDHEHEEHFDEHAPYEDSLKQLHGFDAFPGIYFAFSAAIHRNIFVSACHKYQCQRTFAYQTLVYRFETGKTICVNVFRQFSAHIRGK